MANILRYSERLGSIFTDENRFLAQGIWNDVDTCKKIDALTCKLSFKQFLFLETLDEFEYVVSRFFYYVFVSAFCVRESISGMNTYAEEMKAPRALIASVSEIWHDSLIFKVKIFSPKCAY